jgi:hypothetical protein
MVGNAADITTDCLAKQAEGTVNTMVVGLKLARITYGAVNIGSYNRRPEACRYYSFTFLWAALSCSAISIFTAAGLSYLSYVIYST